MEFVLHVKKVTAIRDKCHTVKDVWRDVKDDTLTWSKTKPVSTETQLHKSGQIRKPKILLSHFLFLTNGCKCAWIEQIHLFSRAHQPTLSVFASSVSPLLAYTENQPNTVSSSFCRNDKMAKIWFIFLCEWQPHEHQPELLYKLGELFMKKLLLNEWYVHWFDLLRLYMHFL